MAQITRRAHAGERIRAFALTACCLASIATPACAPEPARAPQSSASLLAVGDTGQPPRPLPWLFEGQRAVGAAMQREHAHSPVDAVLLLGDNFYPDGLIESDLLERVVQNVALPYCAFIDPAPRLAALIGRECSGAGSRLPQLFAVAGNHDLDSPGSLALQRREIPRLVRNWQMPESALPTLHELDRGLSLVLIHSEAPWDEAHTRQLAAALRAARGPWRVIVGHRPPIAGHPQLSEMVARAASDSGRVVHVYLGGHVHVLGAIRGTAPALTVIAGSGARALRAVSPSYRIDGADLVEEVLGFARIDLLDDPAPERLQVTLLQAPWSEALAFRGNTPLARYSVALDGSVERLAAVP